jgi:ABC-type nitrate/sulfonate/bicarbonate transport system permease component
MLKRIPPFLFGALLIVIGLGVVEGLLRVGILNRYVMPLPSDVAMSMQRIIVEEHILERTLESARKAAVAGTMVILIGVPIGLILYRVRLLRLALEDGVAAMAAAPIVLAFPLFLVLFGRSDMTVLAMSVLTGLPPVILKTLEGLTATRKVLINVGRVLKLTPFQMYWKILLPSSLPTIFTGIRLGWIGCLVSVVGVEFLINLGGLGQIINELAERYDLPGTYAGICFVILMSVLAFMLLERLETWLRPGR